MKHSIITYSLMLISVFLFAISPSSSVLAYVPYHRNLSYWHFVERDNAITPTVSTASPCTGYNCVVVVPQSTSLPCAAANGSEISVAGTSTWTMLCDIDFRAQDIYPFILSGSFDSCLSHCNKYNADKNKPTCVGFVFAPDRTHLDNDCYLKSSVNDPVYPATIHLIGATLKSSMPVKTFMVKASPIPSPTSDVQSVTPDIKRVPTVGKSSYLGISEDTPTNKYVKHTAALPAKLATNLLTPGTNIDLITKYPLAIDTGTWTTDSLPFDRNVTDMKITPRFSRDGGKGGMVDGHHLFIFCDTATYGDEETSLGYLNGFVSSTVAIDQDFNGRKDKALTLVDTIGGWQDDVGRMRGWAPMTTGENSFNIAVSGDGYRYAVWPESSPIVLNKTHAILYASLVYVEVDMSTPAANFTTLGNSLLLISVDPLYGPHADRLVNQIFTEDEVTWGSLGGLRAWSSSGVGTMDGSIYLFGQVDAGILLAKVNVRDYLDRSKYEYWNGNTWSEDMPPHDAPSQAFLIEQPVMDFDMIYSPFHKTFIMVYLTPSADNTLYYRYLQSSNDTELDIIPPYHQGGEEDYVEQILHNKWSEQKELFRVPAPEQGYIYAGGVHAGYFGEGDITEGGTKMLCTWTEHTIKDPNKPESGYAHKAQWVELGW